MRPASTLYAVSSSSNVSADTQHGCLHVTVVGALDDQAADEMAAACGGALSEAVERLEVDLTAMTAASPRGIAVISECFKLSGHLARGVRVSVSSDVGRRAMLDSMTDF